MANEQKKQLVANLVDQLKDAAAVYLTDYRGLTVPQLQDIRSKLQKSGGPAQLVVVKNTLFERSLEQLGYPAPETEIKGPTAVLICGQEETKPLSILAKFGQEQVSLNLKGGYLNKEWLSSAQVETLANLSPIETLRAQTVAALASPISKLQGALPWHLRGFVQVLTQLQERKS